MWEVSPWQLFLLGGPLMWPILVCSVVAAAIVIEKIVFFNSINENMSELKDRIFAAIRKNDIKSALVVCDRSNSPTAKILKAGLLQYGRGKREIMIAMEEAARFEVPCLEEKLPALSAVAGIAPLLGLLGTVTGMCAAFHMIQVRAAAMNPVMPADIAGGIWEALIATAAGLAVAIPAFLAHNFFVSYQNRYVLQMEKAAMDVSNFLEHIVEPGNSEDKG